MSKNCSILSASSRGFLKKINQTSPKVFWLLQTLLNCLHQQHAADFDQIPLQLTCRLQHSQSSSRHGQEILKQNFERTDVYQICLITGLLLCKVDVPQNEVINLLRLHNIMKNSSRCSVMMDNFRNQSYYWVSYCQD